MGGEMVKPFVSVTCGACAALLCACASGNGQETVGGAASAASAGAGSAPMRSTPCPETYKHFSVGASGTLVTDAASNIAMRVDDGPLPPVFGNNTWTVSLTDAATGAPAANAHITWACAFMDVHGHGSNPKAIENLGGGRYKVRDQNTRMFGPWELRFWIDPSGAAPDYVPTTILENGKQCVPTSGPEGKPSFQFDICVPESTD